MDQPKPMFRQVQVRLLIHTDWSLLIVTIALVTFGLITLWGATSGGERPTLWPIPGYPKKQAVFGLMGLTAMIGLILVDYRVLKRLAPFFYVMLLLALMGLLIKAAAIKGAKSWYDLGFMSLQPSEPGKLVLIMALAAWMGRRGAKTHGIRDLIIPALIAIGPIGLVFAQPDLGTAVVMTATVTAMIWVGGVRKWIVMTALLLAIGGIYVGYQYALKPYQKARIESFLNPEADPLGKGYNVIQSQTAMGSGQMFGKGWGMGTQTSFRFLPEYHTDFIFPTVGEQFGFVGATIGLGLLLIAVLRMLELSRKMHDPFGRYLITGIAAMFATHIMLNVGMTIGLLPVTGLPLPFFSYGGSFLLTCLVGVGLVLSAGARREL